MDEFYLIADGQIDILYADATVAEEKQKYVHVLELPTYSYFGDYQIILNIRSMFVFMSNAGDDTTTMCISREKLIQLLQQYPNVHEHWVKMAKLRR